MANYASLYHQVFTTKRLAKQFILDPVFLAKSELGTIDARQRVRAIRPVIGFVLAMYTTYRMMLERRQFSHENEKWAFLIFSRIRLTKFGGKTMEDAAFRLAALMHDLDEIGTPWDALTETGKFIEVCATCYAIESFEMTPGGLPTVVCKAQLALLIPKVFGALKIKIA